MSVVAEVLSAWAGDRDPLTDERIEMKRGKMGIAGRGGNVSNRATGGSFRSLPLKRHEGRMFFLRVDWREWRPREFQSNDICHC